MELKIEKKDPDALFVKGKQPQQSNSRGRNYRGRGQNSQSRGQHSQQKDGRQSSRNQNGGKPNDKSGINCNYCHEDGHFKWDCVPN